MYKDIREKSQSLHGENPAIVTAQILFRQNNSSNLLSGEMLWVILDFRIKKNILKQSSISVFFIQSSDEAKHNTFRPLVIGQAVFFLLLSSVTSSSIACLSHLLSGFLHLLWSLKYPGVLFPFPSVKAPAFHASPLVWVYLVALSLIFL